MDQFMRWLSEHGKDTLESVGLIIGLGYTAVSFRDDAREKRIGNLMSLADAHRDLWKELIEKPELARILKKNVDLNTAPVSVVEERFVHLIITHLGVTFATMRSKMLPRLVGLEEDVRNFFSLPIPAQVWQWSRRFQDPSFVSFVDKTIKSSDETSK